MQHNHIHASHMSLFPTKDSLVEALADIEEEVGPKVAQHIFPLIMSYHNTLLKELSQSMSNQETTQLRSYIVSANFKTTEKA